MREYECLYVLNPTIEEPDATALQERLAQTITATGGEVLSFNPWGKRRLAYEIGRFKEGFYVQVRFNAETNTPAELERALKYAEPVLRHLIVTTEDLDPNLATTIPDQIPEPGSEEWSSRGRGRYRDDRAHEPASQATESAEPAEAAGAEGEAADAESAEAPDVEPAAAPETAAEDGAPAEAAEEGDAPEPVDDAVAEALDSADADAAAETEGAEE